ncbi:MULTISPECIES: GerAB/ArcD/ProY family transporter [Fictibacillus]|jgi:spore germination protein AB|uniref:GerAB/ArcD/ProY family transporter n=1 Tax=Fictibacillus TaxID=1329200 RepID=UPI0010289D98|nr:MULTISPECIES: GerAB/ArcD/ProY family transporter [Fictibacillus]RZT21890.1 spore germination protein (amino acid permease) [Fictibacillus sp. BK138]
MNLNKSKFPPQVHENAKIAPQLVFFLVIGAQIGVGILGFVRYIAKFVNQDSWLVVIAGGLGIHLVIWMMFSILNKHGGDIFNIHHQFFGKWLSIPLSLLLSLYYLATAVVVLRTFIEAVQNWMFPGIPTWTLSLIFAGLAYYIVSKGFRVITGIAFFCFVLTLWIMFTHYFPIKHGHVINLMPFFDHELEDFYQAFKVMVLSFIGFEYLLAYYPHIQDSKKAQKWAHYGSASTTVIYIITTISTLMYFSPKQLQGLTWPTLQEWKIVTFPFIERFEYIGISFFGIVILINLALALWASCRGLNRVFDIKIRLSVIPVSLILFLAPAFFTTRFQVDELNNYTGKIAYYLFYAYLPLLFVISIFKKGAKK